MIDFKIPKAKTRAQAQMESGLSPSGTIVQLKSGEASLFPTGNLGTATSVGDQNTLNSTGIGAKVSVGDFIRNTTDGSIAWVTSTSTDSAGTTDLMGGTDNTWDNSDEWVVGSFYAWLSKKDGSGVDTTRELVWVKYVDSSNDQLHIETRAVEGTAVEFAADDYVSIYVSAQYIEEIEKALGELMDRKAEDDEVVHLTGAETVNGLKTFGTILRIPTSTPTDSAEAVSKAHLDATVASLGGAFALQGSRSSDIAPRILSWTDAISSGNYVVKRKEGSGGSWSTIATVSESTLTYTDGNLLSGDIYYKIEATDGDDIFLTSNEITFLNTEDSTVADGDYGDGSDGAYTSGDLERGNIYQFSEFNLNTSMNITGTGVLLVLVDGDLTLGASAVINSTAGALPAGYPSSMSIHANTVDTSVSGGTGGTGGNGGIGWGGAAGGSGGTGGNDGANGTVGQQAGCVGGTGGDGNSSGSSTQGGGGGGGKGGGYYFGNNVGGDGGDGGQLSSYQQHIIFVVSGNVDIISGSTINGAGGTGGNGTNGSNGGQAGSSGDHAGGGGGGAGSGGSDGLNIDILHEGTWSNAGTLNAAGGSGGTGGTGGSGRGSGATGGTGSSGSAGSITNTAL